MGTRLVVPKKEISGNQSVSTAIIMSNLSASDSLSSLLGALLCVCVDLNC